MVAMFYRAATHAVLLFGLETWVISELMEITVEGTHNGFLRQITGKQARRKVDGTWYNPEAEEVQEAAGTQLAKTYIGRIQEMVAQWVALRPIIKLCIREMGYEGGGRRRDTWWNQEAPETQLRATLEEIL